jgi:hypothetical protein
MRERGELDMLFPTVRTLQSVASFENAQAVVDHAKALTSIERTEPRVVERDGRVEILLPGDDGYAN